VSILWTELLKLNIKLYFAHRSFQWSNEGRGVAAVHCVIMGFGVNEPSSYRLFDYSDTIKGAPTQLIATQINPYLVDAPTVLIEKRNKPLNENTPIMIKGSMPNDGGYFLLSQQEADAIYQNDPIAAKYIRPFLGSEEFINNIARYCLWLKDSLAQERIKSPEIKKRVEQVRKIRLKSQRETTQKLAQIPYLFGEIKQTEQPYLLIPSVSSEQRKFIPIGYLPAEVIASNLVFMLPNASFYDFALLCSSFHNAWLRAVGGRLKSDYRYSNTIVYNNFPVPQQIKSALKQKIEIAGKQVLQARELEMQRYQQQGRHCSLADLYAANNMPVELLKAHNNLDKVIDLAYQYKGKKDDADRVAFLFALYQKITAPIIPQSPPKKAKKTSI
jgi:hypothetical protein